MNCGSISRWIFIGSLAVLSACASLSEKQCRRQDWNGIGYRDGSNGRNEFRINDHQEACAKFGIALDMKAYDAGRQRGLNRYCTIDGGLRAGRSGNAYEGVCPVETEPGFLGAYRLGLEINRVEVRLNELRSERYSIFGRLRELSERKAPKNAADGDRDQDEERKREYARAREREALNFRLREIEREEFRVDSDRGHLEWEARRLR